MLSLSSWSIKLLRFENWNFPRVKKIAKCKHHLLHVSFYLILTRALEHVVCLGESRLSQVNKFPWANVLPAGVDNFIGFFGLHPSRLSRSAGFVFLSGKASLVSISAAILLLRSWHVYFLLEFEFRGKSCVEWEHGGEDGISCLLPCIL